jgi:hypothetical protein
MGAATMLHGRNGHVKNIPLIVSAGARYQKLVPNKNGYVTFNTSWKPVPHCTRHVTVNTCYRRAASVARRNTARDYLTC